MERGITPLPYACLQKYLHAGSPAKPRRVADYECTLWSCFECSLRRRPARVLRKPPRRTNNVAGRPIPRQLAARPTCALLALFPASITNRLSSSIPARTCGVHFIPNESSGSLREIFEAKLKLALPGDTARAGMMLFLGKLYSFSLSLSLWGERTVASDDSDDEIEGERKKRFDYGKVGEVATELFTDIWMIGHERACIKRDRCSKIVRISGKSFLQIFGRWEIFFGKFIWYAIGCNYFLFLILEILL